MQLLQSTGFKCRRTCDYEEVRSASPDVVQLLAAFVVVYTSRYSEPRMMSTTYWSPLLLA